VRVRPIRRAGGDLGRASGRVGPQAHIGVAGDRRGGRELAGGEVQRRPAAVAAAVVWTSLGPLPRWVPGPTTRWAPETTRLALHGTCWRGAQGLRRRSTRLGSCTCPALYGRLLDVLD
jgi:hypothetical protein